MQGVQNCIRITEKHFQNAMSAEASEYMYYTRVGWGGVFQ